MKQVGTMWSCFTHVRVYKDGPTQGIALKAGADIRTQAIKNWLTRVQEDHFVAVDRVDRRIDGTALAGLRRVAFQQRQEPVQAARFQRTETEAVAQVTLKANLEQGGGMFEEAAHCAGK